TCADLLAQELAVAPALETTALAERIRRATQSKRHNLPPSRTPLVGRTAALESLTQQLLQPDCRLVTVLGTGGMGKTRLALAVAERLVPTGHFLNGVRFVPLADVPEAGLLPTAVAAALELTLSPEKDPIPALLEAIAEDELLLVLDNLEHLLDGASACVTADFLADLLTHAPHLKLLVTSRQRLQLQEEWLFPLAGLPPATEGAELFGQTARRIQRLFDPTAEEQAAILQICELVEGLPLGIELAAGWLHQHSCTAIADELAKSLALLHSSWRNVPERHRSITAVFDHSWALLPTHQRQVLARLSCFQGGFTAVAARAIARATPADLKHLHHASLLRQAETADNRYVLHDLLRQYAAEQLAELAETEAITSAHAAYFGDFVAAQTEAESLACRQALQADLPNIRAAWHTAVGKNKTDLLLQMGPILHRFFSAESRFYEGIELFERALSQLSPPLAPPLEADLLGRKAQMHVHMGQITLAETGLRRAIAILKGIDDPLRLSVLLGYLARVRFYAGEFGEALALTEESLALSTAVGDTDGEGFCYNFMGSCHKALGNYALAEECFQQSVAVYEKLGDTLGQAMTLNNLGNLAQAQGDFAQARTHYLTCSRLFLAEEHLHGAATTLANAGRLAKKMGDLAGAEALLQESLALKRAQKDGRGTAVALVGLADTAVAAQEYANAHRYLQEGLALAEQAGDVKLVLEGEAVLAALAFAEGHTAVGRELVDKLLKHPGLAQEVREQVAQLG
ncbi:MAG: tetratricopeptide repeat protein, partial [Anaerolineales bacterium]|nr:tetratricopeptide repeat protein [Anaerolineales bacterium]